MDNMKAVTNRKTTATGNNAQTEGNGENTNNPDSPHECAICTNWLNEPVLTKCGHRFCKSCLNEWFVKGKNTCPNCLKTLSQERDIFPDNFTRREINQKKLKCPNAAVGCTIIGSPMELNYHKEQCPFQQKNKEEKCPFASIKCNFIARSGTQTMEEHIKSDITTHMFLIVNALEQNELASWNPPQKLNDTVPPPPQYSNNSIDVQSLFNRIVVLEQDRYEKNVQIQNLTKQISLLRSNVDPRYSNGTIVWEINEFSSFVQKLRANPNELEYSRECYTSPYGYKFCGRLNIQPKRELLSLHVHLMQSENDFHLDWPFMGKIRLCMVHPIDANLSQIDTIMTKPEILAFFRPSENISARGFGFVEYANISDIKERGFCLNDRLVIKIQIKIV